MTESFEKAKQIARLAIESSYIGTCDIINIVYTKNHVTKIDEKSEEVIVSNQPCRLSFQINNNKFLHPTLTGETSSVVQQTAKLFIAPDIQIDPGSKIIVTQNGVTTPYKKSGQPSVYFSHQEIMLELFDDFA